MTATTTPTRTLADVFRERWHATEASDVDDFRIGIVGAVHAMAPYRFGQADLRPSEDDWLARVAGDADDAAEEAVIAAVIGVYERELRRVPAGLHDHGNDALRDDLALLAAESER